MFRVDILIRGAADLGRIEAADDLQAVLLCVALGDVLDALQAGEVAAFLDPIIIKRIERRVCQDHIDATLFQIAEQLVDRIDAAGIDRGRVIEVLVRERECHPLGAFACEDLLMLSRPEDRAVRINFTAIYWKGYSSRLNNYNYWNTSRFVCLNGRTDLLTFNSAAKLNYIISACELYTCTAYT